MCQVRLAPAGRGHGGLLTLVRALFDQLCGHLKLAPALHAHTPMSCPATQSACMTSTGDLQRCVQ